ncbi:hydroxymethylbilane synthase [Bhargavaea ginsengi]|uniref:Porphobilinogen deaminase n=1 Tax=Bhargavaea ginsengi TaxID=426757 RepID=A0A1H6XLI2_9BACL|nr:hydroxymethylbilane synthase [Bhargavaea ginsengi]MCM3086582.1 hydroxymethylbilane synthase [Bhargavaea ginsengi]SEJ25742.1 hydroxymethylbilane synthase [Bhargavaea ginsengi]
MRKIIVGSRRSNLALTQTNWFIDQLKEAGVPFEFEVKEIVTKGDKILDVMLSKVGGKGLFVKEIEQALIDKEIDFAVHSMKDMPAELQEGLTVGCVPEREDVRDAYIANGHIRLEDLPAGAVVGTSSLRRSSQLLMIRPDIEIKWIRGNIETRLRKLRDGEYDAILLAAAGLNRMGWDQELVTQYLEPEQCIPAVGQGALGIECRSDDEELLRELSKLTEPTTEQAVTAERTFLNEMDGSCQVPIGGHAIVDGGQIRFTGFVASPDAGDVFRATVMDADPVNAGKEAARMLKEQGADEVLRKVKADLDA